MSGDKLVVFKMLIVVGVGWIMVGMLSSFVHRLVVGQWILCMDWMSIMVTHVMWLCMWCYNKMLFFMDRGFVVRFKVTMSWISMMGSVMVFSNIWVDNLMYNRMDWLRVVSRHVWSNNLLMYWQFMMNRSCMVHWNCMMGWLYEMF